jgi:hypothetical protein
MSIATVQPLVDLENFAFGLGRRVVGAWDQEGVFPPDSQRVAVAVGDDEQRVSPNLKDWEAVRELDSWRFVQPKFNDLRCQERRKMAFSDSLPGKSKGTCDQVQKSVFS